MNYQLARYKAYPENGVLPAYVWDRMMRRRSSTHMSYESACARAYVLNEFSTGSYAGGAR